jgi:hypothetical protein
LISPENIREKYIVAWNVPSPSLSHSFPGSISESNPYILPSLFEQWRDARSLANFICLSEDAELKTLDYGPVDNVYGGKYLFQNRTLKECTENVPGIILTELTCIKNPNSESEYDITIVPHHEDDHSSDESDFDSGDYPDSGDGFGEYHWEGFAY